MKFSFLDFLSILLLIAVVIVGVVFLQIFTNPATPLNPFPPATMPAVIVLPSSTATPLRLPPTWTPTLSNTLVVTLQPTSTSQPTATSFTLPTFTITPTFTVTATATPVMTATYTPAPNQAVWVSNTPKDNAVLSPGQDFDMIWTVKNTGLNTWTTSYSYKFGYGEPTHEKSEYDLRKTVAPGNTVELVVDMTAPSKSGVYKTVWYLVDNTGEVFYSVNFVFSVR